MQALGAITMALILLVGATWSDFDWPGLFSSLTISLMKVLAWVIVLYGIYIYSPSFDGESAHSARARQEQEEGRAKKRAEEEETRRAEEVEKKRVEREEAKQKQKEEQERRELNVFLHQLGKPVPYVWELGTISRSGRVQQSITEATSELQEPPTTLATPQPTVDTAKKAKGVSFTPDTKTQSVDDPVIVDTDLITNGVQTAGEGAGENAGEVAVAESSEQKQKQEGGFQNETALDKTLNEILAALKPDSTTVATIESEEAAQAAAAGAARLKAKEDQKQLESFRQTFGQWRFEPQVQSSPVAWPPDYCQHRHVEVDALYRAFVAQMQQYAPMAQHYGIKVCMHCECCGYGPFDPHGQQSLPFMPHRFLYDLQFGSNGPTPNFGHNQPSAGAQDGGIGTGTGVDQSQPLEVAQPAPQENPLLGMRISDAQSTVKLWMDRVHQGAIQLQGAVQSNGGGNGGWIATMQDATHQQYCSHLELVLKYIMEWAAPGHAWDTSRLPAASLKSPFGLEGDKFDALKSLMDEGSNSNGLLSRVMQQIRRVGDDLTPDTSQYGMCGLSAGPAIQQQGGNLPAQNPLLTMSIADAKAKVREWMAGIYLGEEALRVALCGNAKSQSAWEQALQKDVHKNYIWDMITKIDWIMDWAAPNENWDKQKLAPGDVFNKEYKLKGAPFGKLHALFVNGDNLKFLGTLGSARRALQRVQDIFSPQPPQIRIR